MSTTPAPIRIRVDPTNPGQFFACCGLLELADRLWKGAEGWFDGDHFKIFTATSANLESILDVLLSQMPHEMTRLENGLPVAPLIAPLQLFLGNDKGDYIILDAWMTIKLEKGEPLAAKNPPWNLWSGQQTAHRIWKPLRDALMNQIATWGVSHSAAMFGSDQRVPLSGRFGFDPSAGWNALDVGFSPDKQGIRVASSPATELLAAVGLQRFRPQLSENREVFYYSTWGRPLPPSVANAAASGLITVPPAIKFQGCVISRASYAALGYSTIIKGELNERSIETE